MYPILVAIIVSSDCLLIVIEARESVLSRCCFIACLYKNKCQRVGPVKGEVNVASSGSARGDLELWLDQFPTVLLGLVG